MINEKCEHYNKNGDCRRFQDFDMNMSKCSSISSCVNKSITNMENDKNFITYSRYYITTKDPKGVILCWLKDKYFVSLKNLHDQPICFKTYEAAQDKFNELIRSNTLVFDIKCLDKYQIKKATFNVAFTL